MANHLLGTQKEFLCVGFYSLPPGQGSNFRDSRGIVIDIKLKDNKVMNPNSTDRAKILEPLLCVCSVS